MLRNRVLSRRVQHVNKVPPSQHRVKTTQCGNIQEAEDAHSVPCAIALNVRKGFIQQVLGIYEMRDGDQVCKGAVWNVWV